MGENVDQYPQAAPQRFQHLPPPPPPEKPPPPPLLEDSGATCEEKPPPKEPPSNAVWLTPPLNWHGQLTLRVRDVMEALCRARAVIGGRVGGLIGGIKTKRVEAQTVLTLMNVRTSEIQATAEGSASKKDIGFAAGGGYGFGGAVGGGYEDTEVGKVVTYAFLDAYRQIVGQLGGLPDNAAAAAPKEAFMVSAKSVTMRRSPAASSSAVRELEKGDMVYPLGAKEGMWWEIEDENGNAGWVENDKLKPVQ